MQVLVVQNNADLGRIWCRFLERQGVSAQLATSQSEACGALARDHFDTLIIEPVLPDGGGIAVADFATYRNPDVTILAVTNSTLFSDGSIFDLIPNARALMRTSVRPNDLMAYIDHCASRRAENEERSA